MKRMNFPTRVTKRKEEAVASEQERLKRSPEQQLEKLDKKLGTGVGAKKERARLSTQIQQREEGGVI